MEAGEVFVEMAEKKQLLDSWFPERGGQNGLVQKKYKDHPLWRIKSWWL